MHFEGQVTTDKSKIKAWIEARNGWPAIRERFTGRLPAMMLQIVFPESGECEGLKRITWDEFFELFDRLECAFLYQEGVGGHMSYAYNFI